jgi:hypothetical protein
MTDQLYLPSIKQTLKNNAPTQIRNTQATQKKTRKSAGNGELINPDGRYSYSMRCASETQIASGRRHGPPTFNCYFFSILFC